MGVVEDGVRRGENIRLRPSRLMDLGPRGQQMSARFRLPPPPLHPSSTDIMLLFTSFPPRPNNNPLFFRDHNSSLGTARILAILQVERRAAPFRRSISTDLGAL